MKRNKNPDPEVIDPQLLAEVEAFKKKKYRLLGRLLSKSYRFMSGLAAEYMGQMGYTDLRVGHIVLMVHIDIDGISINELAAKAGVSKQAMSKAVKELQEMGYVNVEKHPKDARSIKVKITAKGVDFLYALKNCVIFIESEFSNIIGDQKFTQLKDILGEIADFYDQSHRDNFADMLKQ